MGYSSNYYRQRNYGTEDFVFWRNPIVLAILLVLSMTITFVVGIRYEPKLQAQAGMPGEPLASIEQGRGEVANRLNPSFGFDTKNWEVQYPQFKFPDGGWRTFLPTEQYSLESISGTLDLSDASRFLELGFGVVDKKLMRDLGGYYVLRLEAGEAQLLFAVLGEDRVKLDTFALKDLNILNFNFSGSELRVSDQRLALDLPKLTSASRLSIRTNLSEDQISGLAIKTKTESGNREYQLS